MAQDNANLLQVTGTNKADERNWTFTIVENAWLDERIRTNTVAGVTIQCNLQGAVADVFEGAFEGE
jgi:hypothetical protein